MNHNNSDLSKKFSDEEILNLIAKSGASHNYQSPNSTQLSDNKEHLKLKPSFYIPLAFILLGFCYLYLFSSPSNLVENQIIPPSNLSQKLQEKHQLINATSLEYLTVQNALLELKDTRILHLKEAKASLMALLEEHEEHPQENLQSKLNEAIWQYAEAESSEKEIISKSMEELYFKVSQHKKNDRALFKLLVKEATLTPYLSDLLVLELNPPDYLENFDITHLHTLFLNPIFFSNPLLDSAEDEPSVTP